MLSRPVTAVLPALLALPLAAVLAAPSAAVAPSPPATGQILLGIADDWSSTTARLQAFDLMKKEGWRPAFERPVSVLLGRGGLAWGLGVLPVPETGAHKREGDRKAPAGFFALGPVYGYDAALPGQARYPYRQITRWDAWPDDPKNPYYNRHVVIDPAKGVPSWFEKQKMRHGDPAYRFLIDIRHNSDPKPVPGRGSAIFFHIRRGPDRPSFGCTTMRESDLVSLIQWLRPEAKPHYVLLPRAEYRRLREAWRLPEFE